MTCECNKPYEVEKREGLICNSSRRGKTDRLVLSSIYLMRPCGFVYMTYCCGLVMSVFSGVYITTHIDRHILPLYMLNSNWCLSPQKLMSHIGCYMTLVNSSFPKGNNCLFASLHWKYLVHVSTPPHKRGNWKSKSLSKKINPDVCSFGFVRF